MKNMQTMIDVSMAREPADLVLKNASIINVFTQTIDQADIAITGDTIVGIGCYQGKEEIDCRDLYVSPGFIDAHVHIESSLVTPEIFSHLLIKHGVTTIIADPHEIANVMGLDGIKWMIENGEKGVIDSYFMLPSCVPAVSFEDNGALLDAPKLAQLINHLSVLGLGEVMDVHAVTSGHPDMLNKIQMTKQNGKMVDGHCPQVGDYELNAYLCAGIKTDHECTNHIEALEKVSKGMYVMLREGSAAKDLIHLLPAVNGNNYQRFLFCTDDRHIEDLIIEGSIDHCIRLAIKQGLDPIKAYTMASFNAANCYHLHESGAVAPGLKADLVLFNDLEALNIKHVIKNGQIMDQVEEPSPKVELNGTMNLDYIDEALFQVAAKGTQVFVIKAHPGSLTTSKVKRSVLTHDGLITGVIEEGEPINKIAVIERHHNTGKHFTGFIEGLGLKHAAIAQTIAHDSHNVIVVGDNDRDMHVAVNALIDLKGGIVIVSQGEVLASISLPIGGIMTSKNPKKVLEKMKQLNQLARDYGIQAGIDPFTTLGFMALPVIPELKITTRGLFDYGVFDFIDLFV